MARILVISLTASLIAFWAVSANAENGHEPEHFHPNTIAHNYGSTVPPLFAWPHTNHEPAIGKTLTPQHPIAEPTEPTADYQYEWQYQPAPPAPYLATPQQFAYPKQGYFPRDGKIEQAPGYEYDFGDTGSYPPSTPIEGAKWREPRKASARLGFHAPQPFAHSSGFETHYGCLHW